MFQSYIPADLWSPEKELEVEKWLVENVPQPFLRKEILLDFCNYYQLTFTRGMAVRIDAEIS